MKTKEEAYFPVPIHLPSLEGFDYEVCMKDIAGFGSKNNPLILCGSRDYFLNPIERQPITGECMTRPADNANCCNRLFGKKCGDP